MKLTQHRIMRLLSFIVMGACLFVTGCATPVNSGNDDRSIFNTSGPVTGAKPAESYDPYQLGKLYDHRHETELKMFDIINEAALRRDKRIQPLLNLYRSTLGYVPSLALRHYQYVFGDKSQLDWLLAEDAKHGFGRDSLIVTIFGYMDEWDKTIRRFKQHDKVADGAGGEVLRTAMRIRKQLYGADRFETAWKKFP